MIRRPRNTPMTAADKRRQALKQERTHLLRRLRGQKPIDFNKKPTRNPLYKGPLLNLKFGKGLFSGIAGIPKGKKKPLTMTQKMLKKPIGARMRPKKK